MSKVFTAFYDLNFGPVSFDFITWLVRAMKKREAGKCDRLHVVVVPKEDGLGGFSRHWGAHDEHAAWWRLWHIVVAACPLADATITVAASREHAKSLRQGAIWWEGQAAHHVGPIVDEARTGATVPRLAATAAARRFVKAAFGRFDRPIVTLTMREQGTDPARNSDASAWREFQHWLMGRGYQVIRVEEAGIALERGFGYAELSVDLRLALYELATMNCIGHNGPAVLLHFSNAPYLQFSVACPVKDWARHHAEHIRMKIGEQFPWASQKQRLVYRPDTADVMVEEFSKWVGATN